MMPAMTPTQRNFVEEVYARAAAVGRTPLVVAVMTGYAPQTWYNWEAGRTSPTAEAMDKVRAELKRMERRL